MKSFFAICTVMILVSACSKPTESISERLKKAETIEIEYFGNDGNSNVKVLVSDRYIDSLSNLVSETTAEGGNCAPDGKITYFKKDSVVFVGEFSLAPDCGQISFQSEGKRNIRKLDPVQAQLIPQLKPVIPTSALSKLDWFLGQWMQVEGPDLVSYEDWKRINENLYQGHSWTMYQRDTVHTETIDLILEGEEIYYIPTVPENAGPVRFKLTSLENQVVTFENPEHDFPQKISYEAKGDTMLLAKISGVRNGKEGMKEFPLRRVGKQ